MKLLIPATIAALFVSESLAQRIYATPSATSTSTAPESTPSGYTECVSCPLYRSIIYYPRLLDCILTFVYLHPGLVIYLARS